MTLLEYIKPLTKFELDALADRCETSAGQLKQVARGHRRCGESLAINLERETAGAVPCEELRPDVDWAYLRSTDTRKTA
jgi:DNA-binding transcriptional regulator YdaS (Cro superfamily)